MLAIAGTEVFVWGGYDGSAPAGLANGALYNPTTDTWRAREHEERTGAAARSARI